MSHINDIWFAAKQTQIITMPRKLLETFGETSVHYYLLTPLENEQLKLRTGIVKAARPRIVTPRFLVNQSLENFGEDARKYFEELTSRKSGASIIQYGLCFEKEERTEETFGGNIQEVAIRLSKEAQDSLQETRGVLIGNEAYWETALIFFLQALVAQSLPINAHEMATQGLLAMRHGIPMAVHKEIEEDFTTCSTKQQADALGDKLRDFGLFDEYEDRFFDLYATFCK